jgi:acetoin utilization protein AcuB
MTKTPTAVEQCMTRSLHSIAPEESLVRAKNLMQEHGIRHLPVLRGRQLVGMLTDRDVELVALLDDIDRRLVTVSDAMSTSVYSVAPETPLEAVAEEMASRKYGSAVVMRGHEVVGIFTTVDACRALASVLHQAQL